MKTESDVRAPLAIALDICVSLCEEVFGAHALAVVVVVLLVGELMQCSWHGMYGCLMHVHSCTSG